MRWEKTALVFHAISIMTDSELVINTEVHTIFAGLKIMMVSFTTGLGPRRFTSFMAIENIEMLARTDG